MTGLTVRASVPPSRRRRGARPTREWAVTATLALSAAALAITVDATGRWLGAVSPAPVDLLHAPLLGVGEAALASLAFQAVVMARAAADIHWATRYADALAMARRGWGPALRWVSDDAPGVVAVGACLGLALVHEAAVRGAVVATSEAIGAVAAVTIGVALAVAVRVAAAPDPRAALHASCVAAVVAAVHGPLVLAGTAVAPVVIAHAVALLVVHRA